MLRRIALLMIASPLLAGCELAGTRSSCSRWEPYPPSADPVEYLKTAGCFRVGGVGVSGAAPPEEVALRRVMARPDAALALTRVFREGSRAGRIYALVGLYYTDRVRYGDLASEVRASPAIIETQAGCIIGRDTVRHIIASIEDGAFDGDMRRSL